MYNELFANCSLIETPKELDSTYCVYHQYTVKIPNRDEVHKMLTEAGIGAMIYYPIPLHLQKVHEKYNFKEGMLPITEENTKLVLSLPMFAEITEDEQREVARVLIEAVEKSSHASVGDVIVLTAGVPIGTSGTTNLLKVHCIGSQEEY